MRNIAFDPSCLVESRNNNRSKKKRRNSRRRGTSHESQDTVHIRSVFGACQSSDSSNPCVVEDVVSSANVSLPSSGMEAFVGGIYGSCRGNCAIRNAIYTGSIRVSGGGGGTGVVSGGIAGSCSNCTIEESARTTGQWLWKVRAVGTSSLAALWVCARTALLRGA